MGDGPVPVLGAVDDPSLSRASDGAFFLCDRSGRSLLAGRGNLEALLGSPLSSPDLREALGAGDRGAWDGLFGPADVADGAREELLRYEDPKRGHRWLRVRISAPEGPDGRRLGFARDDTAQEADRERLARAQSNEAEASARLQAAILVNGPTVASRFLEYSCATIPSKLVDGDFLDVFRISPGCVELLLGDVMGKGMEAAILGTAIKFGFFRSLASSAFGAFGPACSDGPPSAAEVCAAAEREIAPLLIAHRSIATLAYGRLHERRMLLEFVDCGHTAIVHYRAATGSCRLVKGADMPLGFADRQDFRPFFLPYREGDVLVVYSDGLSECPGRDGEQFGESRIMYVTRSNAAQAPAGIARALTRLAFEYSEAGFADDVSLVCVKAGPPAEPGVAGSRELVVDPGSGAATDELRAIVARALAEAGVAAEEESARVSLACHEALANIAEHGLRGRKGRCLAEWRVLDGWFSMELSYEGADYDWLALPESPLERFGERGYGMRLIREAMDSVLLSRGFRGEKTLSLCRRLPWPIK